VLEAVLQGTDKTPLEIVKENDWMQITDRGDLLKLCEEVLRENEKVVKQYKAGKSKVFKALMGCVAAKSKQRADMAKCDAILKELLSK
jgi:aspartyl-tRNA(Asn)/glutamyl-tRNA(Gln) amidotransferase subunit B